MPGEELPPVVAVLDGDMSGLADMLLQGAPQALAAFAAEAEAVGAQFGEALTEGAAGAGDALAADIGHEFAGALPGELARTGDEIAASVAEGGAGVGDALAADIGGQFTAALGDVGTAAGAELADGIAAGAQGTGAHVAEHVTEQVVAPLSDSLVEQMAAVGDVAVQSLADGMASAARGVSIGGVLGATLTDAAAEAGAPAGAAMMGAFADGAAAGAAAAVSRLGQSLGAGLSDIAAEVGGTAGTEMAAVMGDAAAHGAAQLAFEFEGSLSAAMTDVAAQVGAAAGDELAATMGSVAAAGIGEVSSAAASVDDVGRAMVALTEDTQVASAAVEELERRVVDLPHGGMPEYTAPSEQQSGHPAVPWGSPSGPSYEEWIAQQEQEGRAGAQALEQGFSEGLTEYIVSPELFAAMTDMGVVEWMTTLEEAAAQGAEVFNAEFAAAIRETAATVDWTTLTDQQLGGLTYALRESAQTAAQEYGSALEEGLAQAASAAQEQAASSSSAAAAMDTAGLGGIIGTEKYATQAAGMAALASDSRTATGALDEVGAAAGRTGRSFGGLQSFMYGPAGMLAYMGMSLLPMVSGAFNSTATSAADFTQAVGQDGNAIGVNTEATIQQILAKQGLVTTLGQVGVSQATLIESAAGDVQAQQSVTSAINSRRDALHDSLAAGDSFTQNTTQQELSLTAEQKSLANVTQSVKDAVQQQITNTAALLEAEQATDVYAVQVHAQALALQQSAEQTRIQSDAYDQLVHSSSGLSQLIDAQTASLRQSAEKTLVQAAAYNEAYNNGVQYGQLLSAQVASLQMSAQQSMVQSDAYDQAFHSLSALNLLTQAQAGALRQSTEQSIVQAAGYSQMATSLSGYETLMAGQRSAMALSDQQYAVQIAAVNGVQYAQDQLSASTMAAVDVMQAQASEASLYASALKAVDGDTISAAQSQLTFKQDLSSLATSIQQNGTSLDENTKAGQANMSAILSAASAAVQNAQNVEMLTGSVQQGNAALQQSATDFEAAAEKAGLSSKAAQDLTAKYFQIPKTVQTDITAQSQQAQQEIDILKGIYQALTGHPYETVITADTSQASQAVAQLRNEIGGLTSSGYNVAGKVVSMQGRASGGPVAAGETYVVGEHGPELLTMGGGGYVTPTEALGGGGSTVINNVYVTVQGSVTAAQDLAEEVRRNLLQDAARNADNGLEFSRA